MSMLIYTLVMTHITIMCVTLFLHRSQAHRSVTFASPVEHFMRFWLWLTTGMITREWVAVHRRHHQASDTAEDPHSPKVHGIWNILFGGAYYYVLAKKKPEVMKLGAGTPDDWIERNVYTRYNLLGIMIMLLVNLWLFGLWGFIVWGVQMLWIPFWAAGVINGLAHWIGYRNYDTKDTSRNLVPCGIWIGGEELHNNHHGNGASAKLSNKWYEFDEGWMWIRLLSLVGLAKVRPTSSVG
jgi:stearoyl-CoA desaturase (Delta-9 desaturase)